MRSFVSKLLRGAAALALAIAPALAGSTASPGAVYTLSNAPEGNEVLVFARGADGTLSFDEAVPTGGLGSGGGLGNQGGLILGNDHRFLFAVNAGSDDVSVFALRQGGLELRDRLPSGGVRPISLTYDRGLLYVLNAGGAAGAEDVLVGFQVASDGMLTPIPGSARSLSEMSTGPAQIGFSRGGDALIVTEKATNRVVTFALDRDGIPGDAQIHPSGGPTPFGFADTQRRFVIVSEAAGGAPAASTVSSYTVERDGSLSPISVAVPTNQAAACWVVATPDGRHAFTTNTGSSSVSSFAVAPDGSLTLLESVAASTGDGSRPIDAAIPASGRYLYVLSRATGEILAYRIAADGSLSPISATEDVPGSANGLAAR